MKTFEQLEAERTAILDQLEKVDEEINDKKRRTIVSCSSNNHGKGCGMASTIADLEYLQTHWYESPHGCMGGDQWHAGEGQFLCPHCGHRNRLYNSPDIVKLKHLFGSIKDIYEEE